MNSTSTRSFVRPGIPDGEYNASVCRIDAGNNKNDGRPRVRLHLKFLDEPVRGLQDWKVNMLTTPESLAFFKEEMRRLEFAVNNAADFRAIEPELYTITLRVSVENGENGNRRIEILGRGKQSSNEHNGDSAGSTRLWSF